MTVFLNLDAIPAAERQQAIHDFVTSLLEHVSEKESLKQSEPRGSSMTNTPSNGGPSWADVKASACWDLFWHHEQGPHKYREQNAAGWVRVGLCPFHEDTRAGNFSVNMQIGRFRCFSCGIGGDAVDYTKQKHSCNFREAVNYIGNHS